MNNPLQEGISALKAGDKVTARRLLGRAIQQDPKNHLAWLWLSGAVETEQERLTCLNKVLALDPENEIAKRGMASLQKSKRSNLLPKAEPLSASPPPSLSAEQAWHEPPNPDATPDWSAALAPAPQVTDMLDHSKTLDQLAPQKRKALEQFVPLITQDVSSGRVPTKDVTDRLVARGFPRKAVEQLVSEIALQPIRAPIRYQRGLSKEDLKDLPSPWFTILTEPRETMRRILYYEPKRHVILLAILNGIVVSLSNVLNGFVSLITACNEMAQQAYQSYQSDAGSFAVIMFGYLIIGSVASVVIGPISGLLGLFISGALLNVTGRWLRGKGYPAEVRAAVAWSAVPRLWGAILILARLLVFGYVAYLNAYVGAISSSSLLALASVFGLLESIVAIWAFIVLLKCLGEAHHFSAWRALGAILVAAGILIGITMILGCLFYLVVTMFAVAAMPMSN
jgi:hypothetical protein